MKRIFASALAVMLMSGSAHAALFTYSLTGTFADGAQLSGSFDYDTSTSIKFTNFQIKVSTVASLFDAPSLLISNVGSYALYVNGNGGSLVFGYARPAPFFGDPAFGSQSLLTSTYYQANGQGEVRLIAGTISDVAAAVPEPATWATMLLGFGLIGAAARRRNPAVAA